MKIIVLMKQTPDTETKPKINGAGTGLDEGDIKWVMCPFDEYAVEEALRIKEKAGGEVAILCMGPARSVEAIRTGLAMGVDRAVHIDDPAAEGSDSGATALLLAEALKKEEPDIVLAGKQAIDMDCGQVPSRVAEILGMAQVTMCVKLEIAEDGKSAVAVRRIEGGEEVIDLKLPAVVSCEKGLNEPRYASLPGIMKAKRKKLDPVKVADLGIDTAVVGAGGSKVKILKLELPPEREAGKILEGELEDQAKELVRLLREEAKAV